MLRALRRSWLGKGGRFLMGEATPVWQQPHIFAESDTDQRYRATFFIIKKTPPQDHRTTIGP